MQTTFETVILGFGSLPKVHRAAAGLEAGDATRERCIQKVLQALA